MSTLAEVAEDIVIRNIAINNKVMDDVHAERLRQINQEGWTHQHDDRHYGHNGYLALASSCYAHHAGSQLSGRSGCFSPPPRTWPWDEEWWKPKDTRRDLVRAAALLIAQIEVIDRKKAGTC